MGAPLADHHSLRVAHVGQPLAERHPFRVGGLRATSQKLFSHSQLLLGMPSMGQCGPEPTLLLSDNHSRERF